MLSDSLQTVLALQARLDQLQAAYDQAWDTGMPHDERVRLGREIDETLEAYRAAYREHYGSDPPIQPGSVQNR